MSTEPTLRNILDTLSDVLAIFFPGINSKGEGFLFNVADNSPVRRHVEQAGFCEVVERGHGPGIAVGGGFIKQCGINDLLDKLDPGSVELVEVADFHGETRTRIGVPMVEAHQPSGASIFGEAVRVVDSDTRRLGDGNQKTPVETVAVGAVPDDNVNAARRDVKWRFMAVATQMIVLKERLDLVNDAVLEDGDGDVAVIGAQVGGAHGADGGQKGEIERRHSRSNLTIDERGRRSRENDNQEDKQAKTKQPFLVHFETRDSIR